MLQQRLSGCSCWNILFSALFATCILTYILDFWHLEFQIPTYLKPVRRADNETNVLSSSLPESVIRPTSAKDGFIYTLSKPPMGKTSNFTSHHPKKNSTPLRLPVVKFTSRTSTYPSGTRLTSASIPHHTTARHNRITSNKDANISCAKLFQDDQNELARAKLWDSNHPKEKIPDESYITMTTDCNHFRNSRKYVRKPLSQEEAAFPIAYSILVYKDTEQFERLLRAIYHPQNWYCVHVDSKSVDVFWKSIQSITGCFDNVFLASYRSDVQWGTWTVLEPELTCMKDLLRHKKWRYFINLTGQEFPLRTNLDLVRILKTYNGSNNLEGTIKRMNTERIENMSSVPHGITVTKGSVHITACRGFVEFVVNDKRALDFGLWLKDTFVPDESFFSSLNHSPQLGVPGAYTGEPETDTRDYQFLTRFKNWGTYPFYWECRGQYVRSICVFGVGDLPLLATRPELFANKFFLEYEPFALDCLEELHQNRTHSQVVGDGKYTIDLRFYASMRFVRNHV